MARWLLGRAGETHHSEPPFVGLGKDERVVWDGRPQRGLTLFDIDRREWNQTWPLILLAVGLSGASVLSDDAQSRWGLIGVTAALLALIVALMTERCHRRRSTRYALTNFRAVIAQGASRIILDLADIRHLLLVPGTHDTVVLSTAFEGDAAGWSQTLFSLSGGSGTIRPGIRAPLPLGVANVARKRLVFDAIADGAALIILIRQLRAELT